MLGTIIALVNLTAYSSTSLVAGFTVQVLKTDFKMGNIFNRCLIIFIIGLSTAVFWG